MISVGRKTIGGAVRIILLAAASLLYHSCFTGIESTPKITASDVKKENIIERPEDSYLADVSNEALGKWEKGKRFYVTDDRISIIFGASASDVEPLKGTVLRYDSSEDVLSITGEPVAELIFLTEKGDQLRYRTDKSLAELSSQATVQIPFTIEMSMVDAVRQKMSNKDYYVLTTMWYDANDQSLTGRKFIPVHVEEILPGNSVYPIKVVLSTEGKKKFALFMTTGNNRKAPRSFGSLFSFDDPHKRYPAISDETWRNIIEGKVALDMTRDECRLSLGAPATVTHRNNNNYLYELWNYENGVYLVFQDGLLKSYR